MTRHYDSSRSVYSGSKRHVVLRSFLSVSNLLDELIEMLGRIHEIDVGRIHNQQRRLVVPVKVVRVRLAKLLQILWRNRLLVFTSALFNALQECINTRLQVNNELWFRNCFRQQIVEAVVDQQLRVVERQIREDLALRKRVVGEDE